MLCYDVHIVCYCYVVAMLLLSCGYNHAIALFAEPVLEDAEAKVKLKRNNNNNNMISNNNDIIRI